MAEAANKRLERFLEAQERQYAVALAEIERGRKGSHWVWYIFPQIRGLGSSGMSREYSIENLSEAEAYLAHPLLRNRLVEICQALLKVDERDPYIIFGSPDDSKLRSSMTLFAKAPNADPVFESVLEKFFEGMPDSLTLRILDHQLKQQSA